VRQGFSILELVVVIGILTILLGLGTLYSSDFYQRTIIESEKDQIVSLLWRARSRALNNVNQTDHGLLLGSSTYVVFQGTSSAARNTALDENFPVSSGINLSGASSVVFRSPDALPAATGTISVSNGIKTYSITINGEGGIDWQ
jgi:prepilin-type N-terminal cleavage/methylation domain-containing protein